MDEALKLVISLLWLFREDRVAF